MTSSGVLVKNLLAGHHVDDLLSLHERFRGGSLVAGNDQLAHGLDGGAVLRTLSRKVLVARNSLTSALASLIDERACELDWY